MLLIFDMVIWFMGLLLLKGEPWDAKSAFYLLVMGVSACHIGKAVAKSKLGKKKLF